MPQIFGIIAGHAIKRFTAQLRFGQRLSCP